MDLVTAISLTLGVAWASGINLYAAVFMLGFMGNAGYVDLPPDLQLVMSPGVMLAAGAMYVVEFFADKVPGLDTGWDALHSFVRIPAGALLAAGAISGVAPEAELIAGLLGGTLAAGSHFTKAGTRVMINTSPEPFSNWTASIGEDLLVIGGLWVSLNHPVTFIVLIILFILLMVWLLPKLWRGIKKIFAKIRGWLGGKQQTADKP